MKGKSLAFYLKKSLLTYDDPAPNHNSGPTRCLQSFRNDDKKPIVEVLTKPK